MSFAPFLLEQGLDAGSGRTYGCSTRDLADKILLRAAQSVRDRAATSNEPVRLSDRTCFFFALGAVIDLDLMTAIGKAKTGSFTHRGVIFKRHSGTHVSIRIGTTHELVRTASLAFAAQEVLGQIGQIDCYREEVANSFMHIQQVAGELYQGMQPVARTEPVQPVARTEPSKAKGPSGRRPKRARG